jgi:hypothetical protein
MNQAGATFTTLDLGTAQPISIKMETIEVEISEGMFDGFAKAFVAEANRKCPLLKEQNDLTDTEVLQYTQYLVTKRIECIDGTCSEFRKLKAFYIPAWIQHCLSMIGEVVIRDKGLRLKPIYAVESLITYEEAKKISDKIGLFSTDLQIVRDAMPRSIEGNVDVMTTALIADYMRSIDKVSHPAFTYVSAFMGLALKEETKWAALYRVQYDDYDYIKTAILSTRGLY